MGTKEREEFVRIMTREAPGMPLVALRALMRHSTTLHRLAEAECNGDWPADNGEREVTPCAECEGGWVPSTLVEGVCKACRIERAAHTLAHAYGLALQVNGDPRGPSLLVKVPSGFTNDWGQRGICVPVGGAR